MWFAWLLCVLGASAQSGVDPAVSETHPDDPLHRIHRFELGPEAPVASVRWPVELEGTLFAWVRADSFSTSVQLRDPEDRFLGQDDGAGGERTPSAAARVAEPGAYTVRVSARDPGAAGVVELHLIAAPETEETLAAEVWGLEAFSAVVELREAGDREGALTELRAILDELHGLPGAESSAVVAHLSKRFGVESEERLFDAALSGQAWSFALAHETRCRPSDHPDLLRATEEVTQTLWTLGDFAGARRLLEDAYVVATASLPEEDLILVRMRANLATILREQGDLQAARELEELNLELVTRQLPDGDERVLMALSNLANTLVRLGEIEAALPIEERVLAGALEAYSEDHPKVQLARQNLAVTLLEVERFDEALALNRQILEVRERTLPAGHLDIHRARLNLVANFHAPGQRSEGRALLESSLEELVGTRPAGDETIQAMRLSLAWICVGLGDFDAAVDLGRALARDVREVIERGIVVATPREISARTLELYDYVSTVLSLAEGAGPFPADPELQQECFTLVESLRGPGLRTARLLAGAGEDVEVAAQRRSAQRASARLAALVDSGADRDRIARARRRMERAQLAILERVTARGGAAEALVSIDREDLARRLEPDEVLIGVRRYERIRVELERPEEPLTAESLVAFVLRSDASLRRVELGTLGQVTRAVEPWRAALVGGASDGSARGEAVGLPAGAQSAERAAGVALRRLVVDPWLDELDGVGTVILALDDVLHAVPIDALPVDGGRLGERLRIQVRNTLWETLDPLPARGGEGTLVVLGDPAYELAEPTDPGQAWMRRWADEQGDLRAATGTSTFAPLAATAEEARAIARLHEAAEGAPPALLLLDEDADRATLEASVRDARTLHLATHGWFAPGSVDDRRASGTGAPAAALSLSEQVEALSPMLLCGLALAGANGGTRAGGVITAEEIAQWDLSACDLAVLSACDTNVGVRRAGQGVASLQMALHMAGARSVVTSLWKVPDEATRELMVGFYRRLWRDGLPTDRALWEAKMELRERGHPPRDWAGWVLTGEPE